MVTTVPGQISDLLSPAELPGSIILIPTGLTAQPLLTALVTPRVSFCGACLALREPPNLWSQYGAHPLRSSCISPKSVNDCPISRSGTGG